MVGVSNLVPAGTALGIWIFVALAKITGGLRSGLHLGRSMFLVLVSARIVFGVGDLRCRYMVACLALYLRLSDFPSSLVGCNSGVMVSVIFGRLSIAMF